ncbi:MAG: MarR family transcriptional regulator [Anaerolineae bacterium]|nr:MarR family transcriptional regulator [Anaerolineae bacterium]
MTQQLDCFDIPTYKLYHLIKDVFVLLDFTDRYILQEFDLTPPQYRVLTLLCLENSQRLASIADRMLVARSTVTRIIDQMEAAQLVARVIDPEDRRAQHVSLTPQGLARFQRAATAHQVALEERFAALDLAEQQAFIQSLEKLCAILQPKLDELKTEGG